MYKGKKILGLIPARGGSKGIPRKNTVNLCGRPLIAYSIEAGRESKYIDYLMVSTDDELIASISRKYGAEVPFLRPKELASDTAKTIDAVLHAIYALRERKMVFDCVILLQPTQPLRTTEDIDASVELFFEKGCRALVSVSEVDDHPILTRSIENGQLKPLLDTSSTCRRQDMPKYYKINGCIYINSVDDLGKDTSFNDNCIPYIMEKSHSVDIDEMDDLNTAERYLQLNKLENS